MLRGLFKMFLLSKLMGGAGRTGGNGKRGCGGMGCLGLIVVLVLAFFLFRSCGTEVPVTDF
ncbi:hypothetical protein MKJ04_21740 [Pontibacter sp. E15-1]|uniref:hypothetical protein n=1 Tax=Pontibacter sp. E15-1 TaxID=2919918 RepID=UPI001F4FD7D0|nr:hypothetical protein [Pontibacter sp. E15-1]MCJ8167479.1 hypothetical protein [Pontibacter sp. E15-1]